MESSKEYQLPFRAIPDDTSRYRDADDAGQRTAMREENFPKKVLKKDGDPYGLTTVYESEVPSEAVIVSLSPLIVYAAACCRMP